MKIIKIMTLMALLSCGTSMMAMSEQEINQLVDLAKDSAKSERIILGVSTQELDNLNKKVNQALQTLKDLRVDISDPKYTYLYRLGNFINFRKKAETLPVNEVEELISAQRKAYKKGGFADFMQKVLDHRTWTDDLPDVKVAT